MDYKINYEGSAIEHSDLEGWYSSRRHEEDLHGWIDAVKDYWSGFLEDGQELFPLDTSGMVVADILSTMTIGLLGENLFITLGEGAAFAIEYPILNIMENGDDATADEIERTAKALENLASIIRATKKSAA